METLMNLPLSTLYTGLWAVIVTMIAVGVTVSTMKKRKTQCKLANAGAIRATFGMTAIFWASAMGSYLTA